MTEEKIYTVYIHTSPSGKKYIGQTRQNPPQNRWRPKTYKHSKHLYSAIEKYGWENFKHEIVATGITHEEANKLEIELIEKHKTTDRNFGYNTEKGGSLKVSMSEEQRALQSKRAKEHWLDPEYRAKVINGHIGKKRSQETKDKISKGNKGKVHDEAFRKMCSEVNIKRIEEHPELRDAMAKRSKANWENPKLREQMKSSMKAVWERPGYREHMSEIHRKKVVT